MVKTKDSTTLPPFVIPEPAPRVPRWYAFGYEIRGTRIWKCVKQIMWAYRGWSSKHQPQQEELMNMMIDISPGDDWSLQSSCIETVNVCFV